MSDYARRIAKLEQHFGTSACTCGGSAANGLHLSVRLVRDDEPTPPAPVPCPEHGNQFQHHVILCGAGTANGPGLGRVLA